MTHWWLTAGQQWRAFSASMNKYTPQKTNVRAIFCQCVTLSTWWHSDIVPQGRGYLAGGVHCVWLHCDTLVAFPLFSSAKPAVLTSHGEKWHLYTCESHPILWIQTTRIPSSKRVKQVVLTQFSHRRQGVGLACTTKLSSTFIVRTTAYRAIALQVNKSRRHNKWLYRRGEPGGKNTPFTPASVARHIKKMKT